MFWLQYVTLPWGSAKPYKAVMVLPVNSTSPEALEGNYSQNEAILCIRQHRQRMCSGHLCCHMPT
jgi:hypothetical protein